MDRGSGGGGEDRNHRYSKAVLSNFSGLMHKSIIIHLIADCVEFGTGKEYFFQSFFLCVFCFV